jgi:Lon protease-like protein
VILLPRANLPLNIFEPRYLQMFEDAISGARLVGVVQPDRQTGQGESPEGSDVPLRHTGTVGRITAFQELDDGRMIVSLAGIARFDIKSETASGRLYRRCRVDFSRHAGDLEPGRGEASVDREALLKTLKAFLEARNLKADWSAIGKSGTEMLVNSLSIMSPYGPEEKQALLEAHDLKTRADILIALAEMELAAQGGGSQSGSLQ